MKLNHQRLMIKVYSSLHTKILLLIACLINKIVRCKTEILCLRSLVYVHDVIADWVVMGSDSKIEQLSREMHGLMSSE